MIQHRSVLQCAVPTQHVSGTAVNVHTTLTPCTKCKFLQFGTVFLPLKYEANPASSWQTETYDCEALSIESKVNFLLKSYISSKTPPFPRFSMAVARRYNGWNLNTSSCMTDRTWHILWLQTDQRSEKVPLIVHNVGRTTYRSIRCCTHFEEIAFENPFIEFRLKIPFSL